MTEQMYQLKKCTVCYTTYILKPLPKNSFRMTEDQCSWPCYNHANYMRQIDQMFNPEFGGTPCYL